MIRPDDFYRDILKPTLADMERFHFKMNTVEARKILMMIAAHESQFMWMYQGQNAGLERSEAMPARGVYQIEPDTLHDLRVNYLAFRPEMADYLQDCEDLAYTNDADQLEHNHRFSTVAARFQLWRQSDPLPISVGGMASYAKEFWNTDQGKATVDDYENAYYTMGLGEWDWD